MRVMLQGSPPSCLLPPLADVRRLGSLPANETTYVVAGTSQIGFPNQANSVPSGRSYVPPTMAAPLYPPLPKAPSGSQGAIDFPYTIKQPAWTGNFFWYTGGPVLNVGYPRYSNDCLEFLRFAVVDSNWDDVLKWFEWAAASFKWSYADAQRWNFGAFRWINARYAPPGAPGSIYWRPDLLLPQGPAVATPAAPTVTAIPVATSGGAGSGIGARLAGMRGLGTTPTLSPSEISAALAPVVPYVDVTAGAEAFLWWSLADLNTFARSLMKYANKAGTTGKCLDSIYGNWAQYWGNLANSPGGPKGFQVTLGQCPMQDNFWQGFGLFVAEVVLVYVGGAFVAPTLAPAASAAAPAAEAAVATTEAGAIAVDTAVDTAAIGGAAGVGAAAAEGGALLTEITVTGAPIVASGVTTGVAAGVAAGAAAGGALVAAAPSAGSIPTQAEIDANLNLQPQIPATPPPVLPPVAAGTPLLSQVGQGANTIKSIVGAGTAITHLLNPPSVTPIATPTALPPASGGVSSIMTGTTFGLPNLAWLALAGFGILIATRRKKGAA